MSNIPTAETLKALSAKSINASDNNYTLIFTEAARKAYASSYAHMLELQEAQHEGVLSLTLHTRTGDIIVPITPQVSADLTVALQEMVDKKLQSLQKSILMQLEELHHEQGDADGTSDRAQVFALCMPQAAILAPVAVPAQSTATPPRLRAARPHREAEAA